MTITICTALKFLSTLSLRRATTWARGSRVTYVISIHALLAESDRAPPYNLMIHQKFLSTLSLRRATVNDAINGCNPDFISIHALLAESDRYLVNTYHRIFGISIHALLAESDGFGFTWLASRAYFYPRSPCGERLFALWMALNRL